MNQIIDKGLLLIICMLFLLPSGESTLSVVALLLAVLCAALSIYLNSKKSKTILLAGYMIGCLFLPELLYFLPILTYDCLSEKNSAGFFLLIPICNHVYTGAVPFSSVMTFMLWLGMCALSCLLAYHTSKLLFYEQKLIHLRDTSTELNLVLKEKNKDLMEKQDYEIYLATLKERNRIAREIHDHVGHMLSRSILQIGALATIHKEEPLHEQLCQVNETLNHAMTNIRESVHDLHDESIDLRQAITEATSPLRDKYSVTIDFDMSPTVPRNVKYCIISTVKEAVSNIIKHSNATRVSLIFREHPGLYQLNIEDNGNKCTKPVEALMENGGIGLNNMRERVEALGGIFRVHTENGFHISFSIPRKP